MSINSIPVTIPSEHPNELALAGLVRLPPGVVQPDTLLIHGAGSATKERSIPISDMVLGLEHGTLSFDHSGHGETGGTLEGNTVSGRIVEARRAASHFLNPPRAVIGFSMGGHIAIELAISGLFDRVLLLYPAIYPDEALTMPFGDGFTEAIRVKDAWKESQLFQALENFQGRLGLVIGENDNIIPKELPSLVIESCRQAQFAKAVVIPDAPHLLIPRLVSDGSARSRIADLCKNVLVD